MTGKDYFESVSSSQANAGSIMYWNSASHVALVTMIDGSTIRYSQHSNVKQTATYHVYNSSTMSITFYKPK